MPSAGKASASRIERGDDRGGPRAALDRVAPARRGRLAVVRRASSAAEERDLPHVDARAEVGQQRGQQRDRREHHDEHGERGRDGDAVHVGQAGQEQAEHRDHDGAAGDDHAAAGGRDGLERPRRGGPCRRPARRGSASARAARSRCRRRSRSGPRRRSSSRARRRRSQAARSGRPTRCRGRRARSPAAGRGDDRAERDQQHDRRAEEAEALGAGRAWAA